MHNPTKPTSNIICSHVSLVGHYGSQDVQDTSMHAFDLSRVKELKISSAASLAIQHLLKREMDGFWIHLDADVLDDSIMPAVDYRLNGGLGFNELSNLLKTLFTCGAADEIDVSVEPMIVS
jgi:arginase